MAALQPQFIKDAAGKATHVVLTTEEFEQLLDKLEDLEDVRLYDKAKAEDDGERIPMEQVFAEIEASRSAPREAA